MLIVNIETKSVKNVVDYLDGYCFLRLSTLKYSGVRPIFICGLVTVYPVLCVFCRSTWFITMGIIIPDLVGTF